MATQQAINDCVLQAHANLTRVRELVDGDPDLATGSAEWDETPLQAASHTGQKDIALFLLDHGASLDLFSASMLGNEEVVSGLLENDPRLASSQGVHGLPSLFFPALTGHISISQRLLDNGADVNAGAGGNTPLHAAAMGGQQEMANWLLKHGADTGAVNYEGKIPATVAEERRHRDVAELITSKAEQAL